MSGDGAGEEMGMGMLLNFSPFGEINSQWIEDQLVRMGIGVPHESPFPHAMPRGGLGKGTENGDCKTEDDNTQVISVCRFKIQVGRTQTWAKWRFYPELSD